LKRKKPLFWITSHPNTCRCVLQSKSNLHRHICFCCSIA